MLNQLQPTEHMRNSRRVYATKIAEHIQEGLRLAGIVKSISRTVEMTDDGITIALLLDYTHACQFFIVPRSREQVRGECEYFVRSTIQKMIDQRLGAWREFDDGVN